MANPQAENSNASADELNEEAERGSRLAKQLAEHLKWMGADEAEFQYVDEDGSVYRVKIQRDPVNTKRD